MHRHFRDVFFPGFSKDSTKNGNIITGSFLCQVGGVLAGDDFVGTFHEKRFIQCFMSEDF